MKTAFVAALLLGLAAPAMAGWSLVGAFRWAVTGCIPAGERTAQCGERGRCAPRALAVFHPVRVL